jgi:isopenicillin N synthase-like dioxygenase
MGLLTENNDPYVLTQKFCLSKLSTKKGELHEAFNLGLDPSLDAEAFAEQSGSEGLSHSENLWPRSTEWEQAMRFVRLVRGIQPVWRTNSNPQKEATLTYYSALLRLGQSLFPLFARALNLPPDFFDNKVSEIPSERDWYGS